MQPKKFRYTLIVPGVNEFVLPNAPKGWLTDTELDFKRTDRNGMERSVTVPLVFTFGGARILRQQFYQYGAQANVFFQVEKLDQDWQYLSTYYGKLDFSTADDKKIDFTINATEADISVKIKAFQNVKYEIPVTGDGTVLVELLPLKLNETADLLFTPSTTDQQPGYTAVTIVNNEQKATIASVKDAGYRTAITPNFAIDGDWFYQALATTSLKINISDLQGSVQAILTGGADNFKIQIVKNNGVVIDNLIDITIENTIQEFTVNKELNFTLNAGEKLFLYQRITGNLNSSTGFNYTSGQISLTYQTESKRSFCRAIRPKELFKRLVNKMNGGFDYPVQSFLLDQYRELSITSGDAIRGIDDAVIKTSFNDFFKSIDSVLCAGSAVENGAVTIESRQSYYRANQALSLDDAKDIHVSPATDLMFNRIKVGYPDQTYDELNGKFEVNSQQNYVIDVTQPDKELDLMSIYRADAYGIEFLRINLEGKGTTDNDADNDTFFIYLNSAAEPLGYYRPLLTSVIIGIDPSYYNWYISPKRNLLRHGAWFRSVFFGNDDYQIRFASALKNTDITTVDDDGFKVVENTNVNIGELPAPYFQPYYIDLSTNLPNDFWKFVNNTVYGYSTFPFRGSTFNAYHVEISVDLGENSERDFKLLLTADNNILEIIG